MRGDTTLVRFSLASGTPIRRAWRATYARARAATARGGYIPPSTLTRYINNSSSEATPRGTAANIYANSKNKSVNKIIHDKNLDIEFQAITFSTYGGFAALAPAGRH